MHQAADDLFQDIDVGLPKTQGNRKTRLYLDLQRVSCLEVPDRSVGASIGDPLEGAGRIL